MTEVEDRHVHSFDAGRVPESDCAALKRDKPGRVYFLDAMRIFAFASVFIGHKLYDQFALFSQSKELHASIRWLLSSILPFCGSGGAGVVVFFLVSGYVITYVLFREGPAEFAIRRVFRIYPLFITAVAIENAEIFIGGGHVDLLTVILQCSLLGDFFGTPGCLQGIDWTLRLEMVFYVLMAVYKWLGLFDSHVRWLPIALISVSAILLATAPFPTHTIWTLGNVSIYGHFLIVGALIYLYEAGRLSGDKTVVMIGFCLGCYYYLVSAYQPIWMEAHFAALAVLLFTTSWAVRGAFNMTPALLFISNLTFSVYLFHGRFFDIFKEVWVGYGVKGLALDSCAVISVLVFCALLMYIIEKPFIRLGRALSSVKRRPVIGGPLALDKIRIQR
jgi:peptidoglycan/LPS O-acetylase OafA/YrhL